MLSSCSVTTYFPLLPPPTPTLPRGDRVQALPDHHPLLVLASSLQVEAVRGLEVGWQVVNLVADAELRVGVDGLVVLVLGLLVHVVSGGEIGV